MIDALRTSAVPAAAIGSAALGTIAVVGSGADLLVWVPDLVVGFAWLLSAVVAPRGARGLAVVACAVAATWWLGEILGEAVFLHRAVVVHAVFAVPGWMPPGHAARGLVIACYIASFLLWPWQQPAGSILLAAAIVACSAAVRHALAPSQLVAAAIVAAAFAAPAVGAAAGLGREWSVAVWWAYSVALIATAALCHAAARRRTKRSTTDFVVEMGPLPREALERAIARERGDSALHAEIDAALAAAEALTEQHARLRSEQALILDEVSRSRARFLTAQSRARAALQSELGERTVHPVRALIDVLALDAVPGSHAARAQAHLIRALADIDALGFGQRPPVLERGLRAALLTLTDAAPAVVSSEIPDATLHDDIESCVYFVAAEALANATKHAQATAFALRLMVGPEGVRLEFADDGIGGADPARGSGLAGIAARASALGGHLTVASPPGGGTTILLELPAIDPAAALNAIGRVT